jgi:hypothetical protein
MLKHMDDRRRCPHCRRDINERPYGMSRRAKENVLSWTTIAWIIVVALVLILITI